MTNLVNQSASRPVTCSVTYAMHQPAAPVPCSTPALPPSHHKPAIQHYCFFLCTELRQTRCSDDFFFFYVLPKVRFALTGEGTSWSACNWYSDDFLVRPTLPPMLALDPPASLFRVWPDRCSSGWHAGVFDPLGFDSSENDGDDDEKDEEQKHKLLLLWSLVL